MFEVLVVILLLTIIVLLLSLKRAMTHVADVTATLATNPIRHHVNVESDMAKKLDGINEEMTNLLDEMTTLRRHFVSDELIERAVDRACRQSAPRLSIESYDNFKKA